MKLDYGIFRQDLNRSILDKMVFCLIRKNQEYHGFFYAVVIDEAIPLVHQGLIMIIKNDGVDLLTAPYHLLNQLIYEELGHRGFYSTNITAMPKSIGAFCDLFNDVWPSPAADLSRCSFSEYRELLDVLMERYVRAIFPYPDQIKICKNRFVLKSRVSAMGFSTDFHSLARDPRFDMNLFTYMWLKHGEEEDMVQVGKYSRLNYERTLNARSRFFEV